MRMDANSRTARFARPLLWLAVVAALAWSLGTIHRQGWSFGPFFDLVRDGVRHRAAASETAPPASKPGETTSARAPAVPPASESAGLPAGSPDFHEPSQPLPATTYQETDIWQHVRTEKGAISLKPMTLTATQLANIKRALNGREQLDVESCASEEHNWVEKVSFEELPVSDAGMALLVEAGAGCARGGQGANGAMWVVRLDGDKVSFLATPEQSFDGFLYTIQPATSHGLRDLVLGWHISGSETGLGYFSFDGTSYRCVGKAELYVDGDGTRKIVTDH